MKAIILAGGKGSRLWPLTNGYSKQLLPVYDKPMIHYSIATAMHAGMREILIVSSPEFLQSYKNQLGTGESFGISISYAPQEKPKGIAEGLQIGKNFLGNTKAMFLLGDNIFHGRGLGAALRQFTNIDGAQVFGYRVSDPTAYGVVEISSSGETLSIEEKPLLPKSNLAIPGLYFFDEHATTYANQLKPSSRGELEITDLLKIYLLKGQLKTTVLPRGSVWLDAGTPLDLQRASNYIQIVEERQGQKVACLEEIAYANGWLDDFEFQTIINNLPASSYKSYLQKLCD